MSRPSRPANRGVGFSSDGVFEALGCGHDETTQPEEKPMSSETDKAVGRMKQAAGDLTGDDQLKAEGEADEAAGGLKETIGDAADVARDAVDSIKDKLTGKD